MFVHFLLGFLMIAITVTIQAFGSSFWIKHLSSKFFNLPDSKFNRRTIRYLILTAFFLLMLNFSQSILWSFLYYFVPNLTDFKTIEEAIYFSLITFTSLGYGDITIHTNARVLSGIEALNGILLVGWSTTLMFTIMQNIVKNNLSTDNEDLTKLTKNSKNTKENTA